MIPILTILAAAVIVLAVKLLLGINERLERKLAHSSSVIRQLQSRKPPIETTDWRRIAFNMARLAKHKPDCHKHFSEPCFCGFEAANKEFKAEFYKHGPVNTNDINQENRKKGIVIV